MRSITKSFSLLATLFSDKQCLTPGLIGVSSICALTVGQPILLPLGLGAMLALLLSPAVTILKRTGVGHVPAVALCIGMSTVAIATLELFIEAQFAELTAAFPQMHATGATLLAAMNVPLPVSIAGALSQLLLNPLTATSIFLLFAALLLIRRDNLLSYIARLANIGEAGTTICALGETAQYLGRHLFLQGLSNLAFGGLIAAGLGEIGLPNPQLWALFAVLLRFVPFVGVPAAAACPLMLTIATDPTGWLVCATAILFLVADFAIRFCQGKFLPPDAPRLNPIASVVSTVAWTAFWGLGGLILAVPLTYSLVLLGRHFPSLHFLNGLLAPVKGSDEDVDKADIAGSERNLAGIQDATVKALLNAQREFGSERLYAASGERLVATITNTVAEFDAARVPEALPLPLRPWNLAPGWESDRILSLAGPGTMDKASAALLSLALKQKGLPHETALFWDASPDGLQDSNIGDAQIICISCLDPGDLSHLLLLVRRLRLCTAQSWLIAGLWAWDGSQPIEAESLECDRIAFNMSDAVKMIEDFTRLKPSKPAELTDEIQNFKVAALAA